MKRKSIIYKANEAVRDASIDMAVHTGFTGASAGFGLGACIEKQ